MHYFTTNKGHKDLRFKLLVKSNGRCFWCLIQITFEDMTIDHYYPIATYPQLKWVISNMNACCQPCNNRKGSMEPEDFRQLLHLEQRLVANV